MTIPLLAIREAVHSSALEGNESARRAVDLAAKGNRTPEEQKWLDDFYVDIFLAAERISKSKGEE